MFSNKAFLAEICTGVVFLVESRGVQVPPRAPCRSKLWIACSDLFYMSERAHAAAPPFQTEPAYAGLRFGAALRAAFFLSVLTVCSKFESHVLANWGWDVVFKFVIPLWYAGNQSCYSGVLLQNIIWILQAKGKDIILESEDMACSL